MMKYSAANRGKMPVKRVVFPVVVLILLVCSALSGCTTDELLQTLHLDELVSPAGASQPLVAGIPTGPSSGKEDQMLTFNAKVDSYLDGELLYGFYWGDGSYTWSSEPSVSNSWPESGVYTIRVKVRCGEIVSDFSPGKVVMIGSSVLSRSPRSIPHQAVKYITPHDEEIEKLVDSILNSNWRRSYNDFDALRQWVSSNVRYKTDYKVHGVSDYWQLPIETIEYGTGDCEDIAILMCTFLRAAGIPDNEVYVTIGRSQSAGGSHAYLFERCSKGIWSMMEPQVDPSTSVLTFQFLDYAMTYDYSDDIICFNDKYYFDGPPPLGEGVYEFELMFSPWPFAPAATAQFERYLTMTEKVKGSIQWVGDAKIFLGWNVNVYGPEGDIVLTWSGNDTSFDFTLIPTKSGTHTIEVVKREFAPRCAVLKIDPSDWQKVSK
jgi:predicted transglutaminase-like cysteine proteinase